MNPRGIRELRLLTNRLEELRRFYGETLGLPLIGETTSSITIRVGATRLEFVATSSSEPPSYHFAFDVPENKLPLARPWMARLRPLLERDGSPIVHFPTWNAHSIYWYDPGGNLGELIARHNLDNRADGPFTASDLLYASEIGIVVDDVHETVRTLGRELGIEPWEPPSSEFAPVGEEHRLLIVVKRNRPWAMSKDHAAHPFETAAVLTGARTATCRLPGLPYEISVRPPETR